MNKKLYSLFFLIYLIVLYCATVQGNKDDNGKNDRHGKNIIKKNYNKNNKQMKGTNEDHTEDNEEFDENYEDNKESMSLINKKEKKESKANKLSKIQKAYAFGITTVIALNILFLLKNYVNNNLADPNGHIPKLINKAIAIKN
ncbi:hypothetical protein YYC_00025 [Plasmodium yoelii 17X]|uniref:CRA domain-containing protein n=1 Tax=Plasmodium yoelii 17X TaxID=1323249 RepID=V7PVA0_PLAYE|nr:hypothetical protein YYC_00025 [Plasmodium yoelii 17X]